MEPRVISVSNIEPISLDEAALNLHAADDGNSPPTYHEAARILKLITAAREMCEQETEMTLVTKTLEIGQTAFGACIPLPAGPVRSVVSITYIDADGADVVLPESQYALHYDVVWPAYGVTWPTARNQLESVRTRYTVGYPSTDSPPQNVPEPIRQAMHLYIGHYFANREAVDRNMLAELPLGVSRLLSTYRKRLGV